MNFNSDDLTQQLIEHEGLRLKPYLCTAGKTTIGVGRNLTDVGITEQEAMILLSMDIDRVITELFDKKPSVQNLSGVRQRVLLDMAFNLGTPTLLKFKKMWEAIEEEDWDEASAQMLDSRWATQVGRRAIRLSDAMRTDTWV